MLDFLFPWQARERFRAVLEYPVRRAARRNLAAIRRAGGLSVGFGGVLDDGRPVCGGAVKLLPLREVFGGNEREFGILYAVSSSQPACAQELFRHCRRTDIKIVWNQNGVGYPAWAGVESERFNRPMRELRAMADFVIYQSEFCKTSAEKFLGPCGIPSEILMNPVDLGKFVPVEAPEHTSVRLLAAGTHGTRDRVTSALDALRALRHSGVDATLTVAGKFQWKNGGADIAREIHRLGISDFVTRVPQFSQADAAALYQRHDLLLHPKYMDACPTVVLEAMACGLPVVGSRSGGMPEIVPDSCGVLVGSGEDWAHRHTPGGEELAAGVLRILPSLATASAAARRYAGEKFNATNWVEAHRRIFRRLAGS